MIEVTLYGVGPMTTMNIVAELRESGYVQRRDFEFTYYPPEWDDVVGPFTPRRSIFSFKDEYTATWFSLKYADCNKMS